MGIGNCFQVRLAKKEETVKQNERLFLKMFLACQPAVKSMQADCTEFILQGRKKTQCLSAWFLVVQYIADKSHISRFKLRGERKETKR